MIHSEETIETIRRLAGEGLSGGQIAGIMEGMNRNKVIGLAFRNQIRLEGHAGGRDGGRPKMPKKPRISKPPEMKCEPIPVPDETPPDMSKLIPFDELTPTSCRYPFGDRDYLFCNNQKYGDYSYCIAHLNQCLQPPR